MITKARFLKYFKKEEKKETINVGGETREVLSSVTFTPTMYSVVFPNRSYKTMLTDLATETPPNEEGNYMIEDTTKKLSNVTLMHYNNIRKKEMADIEELMNICKDFKLTGSSTQYFARNGKLSDLVITPNDEFVKWYSDPEATIEITTDIDLVHDTTYYAVRDNGTCKATLNIVANDRCFDFPTAPTGSATQTFDDSGTIANLTIDNNAYATWFSDSGLTTEIETSTPLVDGETYYVANKNEYCVSGSLAITTNDRCLTIDAPTGSAEQTFTPDQKLSDLVVSVPPGGTLQWYSDAELNNTLSNATELVHGTTYYAATIDGACKRGGFEVSVTNICHDFDLEVADDIGTYSKKFGETIQLSSFDDKLTPATDIEWSINNFSETVPATTSVVHGTTYYVRRNNGTCVSEIFSFEANDLCDSHPELPVGDRTYNYENDATVASMQGVFGDPFDTTYLKWYNNAALTGDALEPSTVVTSGSEYYAVYENNACVSNVVKVLAKNICLDLLAPTMVGGETTIQEYLNQGTDTIENFLESKVVVPADATIEWLDSNNTIIPNPDTTVLTHGAIYKARTVRGACKSVSTLDITTNYFYNDFPILSITGGNTFNYENDANINDFMNRFQMTGGGGKFGTMESLIKFFDGSTELTGNFALTHDKSYTALLRHEDYSGNSIEFDTFNTCSTLIAPTGTSPQTFEEVDSPTIANIVVSGENLKWYSTNDEPLGTVLPTSTPLVNGETYYVRAESGTACRTPFLAIEVVITPAPEPEP